MSLVQIKRRKDGSFIRVQMCTLPGHRTYPFFRRYVLIDDDEYEVIGSAICRLQCELRHKEKPSIIVCMATDNGEGQMQVIAPEFLQPVGRASACTHMCAYRKLLAKMLREAHEDNGLCLPAFVEESMARPETIKLNPEMDLSEVLK